MSILIIATILFANIANRFSLLRFFIFFENIFKVQVCFLSSKIG